MGKHSSEIIACLKNGEIEAAGYFPGVQCAGYRLAARFLGDRCVRVALTNKFLIRRWQAELERLGDDNAKRWTTIHHALNAEQYRLSIDATEADRILDTLHDRSRLCQSYLVENLRRREFPFSVSSTGRVFNAITGLKREIRHRALRIDGQPVGGIDIACAQPALLAIEMSREGHQKGATYKDRPPTLDSSSLSPDAADFTRLVSDGGLYDRLMDLSGLDNRAAVKLAFLRDVVAKRGKYPSAFENAFRNEFPSVYHFIRLINVADHGELIRRLQRAESTLVIETVLTRLLGRVPVVTLHDAIYSRRNCLDIVESAFYDTFNDIGFSLTLKRE